MCSNIIENQTIPVGQDLFKKVRKENLYYVDKTRFVEQLISNACKVSYISRPRSFGKTMNMSMLKSFCQLPANELAGLLEADLSIIKYAT